METEHYIDGEHHGGVYNSFNLSTYSYCYQNPILLVDPNGKQNEAPYLSANSRTILFAIKHPAIAGAIGEVRKGSDNISSISSRYATTGPRKGILSLNSMGDDEGSERGAFRHTVWQTIITSTYGADIAKQVGDAHEENPNANLLDIRTYNNIADADQTVDLLNNIIGRSLGGKLKSSNPLDAAKAVLEEFHNNGLWQAKKEDNKWEVFKARLSDDKYKTYKDRLNNLNKYGRDPKEQKNVEIMRSNSEVYSYDD